MFLYCVNNPVLYSDSEGLHAELPPMIGNGLNLPAGGGIPIVIDGTTYYYAISYNSSGQLYEYWFDVDGNLVHVRHHSTHGNEKKHSDPHDHKGGKDKNGNNTLGSGPQDVDEKFQSPKKFSPSVKEKDNMLNTVAAGAIVGVAVYQVAKWIVATVLAPYTGGASYLMAIA